MSDPIRNFYHSNSSAKVTQIRATEHGLFVQFSGAQEQLYRWFWLRDHSTDADSLDQITLQRKVDTFSIPQDIACVSATLDAQQQLVHLSWNNGEKSSIAAGMLASVVPQLATAGELSTLPKKVLWSKHQPLNIDPQAQFDEVMQSEPALLEWLSNIHVYGYCLVHGVPSTEQATVDLAERIGDVQHTIFGRMWPLSSELTEHGDSAYSESFLEPHTDGTYYHNAAGLQLFNCIELDCFGGESIQVDGFAIAEQIKQDDPKAYDTLCRTKVPGQYIEPGVHLCAERTPFRLDRNGALEQISFNNYDRAPFLLAPPLDEEFQRAYAVLHGHLNDQENWRKIRLQPGTTLIFDNWRNLHGRMSFTGKRFFIGCYHSRAVYESRLRVLQAKHAIRS